MVAFQNIYYKRTAATAKACYMCFRPTTTVLATLNTIDFLYTCDGHLTDRGFATLIEPPQDETASETTNKVSDEEIRRIREEWEERQRVKQEKLKESGSDKQKDVSKESEPKKSIISSKSPPPTPSPIPVPGSSVAASAKPTHQRYTLHRDVYGMRLTEHKKRRQTTAVKEVAPRLPVTPRGAVP